MKGTVRKRIEALETRFSAIEDPPRVVVPGCEPMTQAQVGMLMKAIDGRTRSVSPQRL